VLVPAFTFRVYFPTGAAGELVTDSRHWGGNKERRLTDAPPWPQARHKYGTAGPAQVPKLAAMGVCAGREEGSEMGRTLCAQQGSNELNRAKLLPT